MVDYNQNDIKWKKYKIGKTKYTLYSDGCYIFSVCRGVWRMRGFECDPVDALKWWTFDKFGYFCPSKTKIKGAEYVGNWKPFYSKMREYTTADKFCVLKVSGKKIPSHFVFVEAIHPTDNTVLIYDSLGGKIKELKASGYTALSLRLYKKKDV